MAGGTLSISAEAIRSQASGNLYASSVGLNLVAEDAAGQLISQDLAVDPADSDVSLDLDLAPGIYVFRFEGAGGIGDLGAYSVSLSGTAIGGLPPFQIAVAQAGLINDDALPNAIPFHDGVQNILKFAFNMDLAGPDAGTMTPSGNSGLPAVTLLEDSGQTFLQVEFVQRKDGSLIYSPEKSTTLEAGDFAPLTGTPIVENIDADWQRVIIREAFDPHVDPKGFIRVGVNFP